MGGQRLFYIRNRWLMLWITSAKKAAIRAERGGVLETITIRVSVRVRKKKSTGPLRTSEARLKIANQ